MSKLGLTLAVVLTLVACKSDAGDDSTGSEGSSDGTSTGGDTTTTGGTTTGTPTTTEGTTGVDTTTGVDEALCADYCADIITNCTGAEAQYPGMDSCLRACSDFPAGEPDAVSGNSYACRRYHTDAAGMDAATHCVHAGPGGGGACGDNCQGFCAIAVDVCPAEHPSEDACLAVCMGFSDSEKYDISDAGGDTLACRLYHLLVAATGPDDAGVHCPHTLQDSPPCT